MYAKLGHRIDLFERTLEACFNSSAAFNDSLGPSDSGFCALCCQVPTSQPAIHDVTSVIALCDVAAAVLMPPTASCIWFMPLN